MHFSGLPSSYLLLQQSLWQVSARLVLQFAEVNAGLEALCLPPLLRRGLDFSDRSHPADRKGGRGIFLILSTSALSPGAGRNPTGFFITAPPLARWRAALCFSAASPTASPRPKENSALVLISPTTNANAQGANLEGFNIPTPDLHHARFALWLCFLSPCLAALLLPPSAARLMKLPHPLLCSLTHRLANGYK